MATKRMLIDASHSEETRVIIVDGNRLVDFDVEVESRRQLKGNIYLAKITRVEPSLQAAFVDYGGNRHGFLAFSEIHSDYYQIPVSDREALVAEDKAEAADDDPVEVTTEENGNSIETLGGDDSEDVEVRRTPSRRRNYKIQEVIKRRQVLLVQVVKEERGNKGAALTTYLSLAGRYCVLMPNTPKGGGISRKITNANDRKRLKTILNDLEIPEGMAVIVRTAGSKRSKAEIKRDYDYLIRLWSSVRDLTLESTAPSLVHEEGNLIKRSIRDQYNKDIDEIIVHGDKGYRAAKDFMKLLIPSHTKKVQPHKDEQISLTNMYQVESQLAAIHSPIAQLRSGGYIVINPTEALVSIDVNSGRSTKERNIEETALNTNLEAAEEIARQLKLRDLSGLVVIDFIDMEQNRNQVKVERQLKEAMRTDRARIQIGRISPFGLLEMSRQRLRPSLIENSSEACPHCDGTGVRRSTETTALHILRAIEEEGMKRRSTEITIHVPTAVALYILNVKRQQLAEIETKYEFTVYFENDDSLIPPDHRIEILKDGAKRVVTPEVVSDKPTPVQDTAQNEENGKRRRRRPRRRKGGELNPEAANDVPQQPSDGKQGSEDSSVQSMTPTSPESSESDDDSDASRNKRRRRGRRGGKRRGKRPQDEEGVTQDGQIASPVEVGANVVLLEAPENKPLLESPEEGEAVIIALPDESSESSPEAEKKPARQRRPRGRKPAKARSEDSVEPSSDAVEMVSEAQTSVSSSEASPEQETPVRKPRTRRPRRKPAPVDPGMADQPEIGPEQPVISDISDVSDQPKPDEKPKTRRPRRAKSVDKKPVEVAGADQSVVEITATDPVAPTETPAAQPVEPEPQPTEPVVQQEVAKPTGEGDHSKTTTIVIGEDVKPEDKPAKRGWWRRG